MGGRYRTPLDRLDQSRAMGRIQERRFPRRLPVDQSVRTGRIELHHPVPDDLQCNATDPRCLRPARSLIDRRQREQPPSLSTILRFAGSRPYGVRVEIGAKRDSHGKLQSVCHLESGRAADGNPIELRSSGFGISRHLLLELSCIELLEISKKAVAGIVDEHVDPAKSGHGLATASPVWPSLATSSSTNSRLSVATSLSTFFSLSILRPVATTRSPAFRAARAVAAPMPLPAPVMNQTLLIKYPSNGVIPF